MPSKKQYICGFIKNGKRCTRGLWCTFAHDQQEIGLPIPEPPPGKNREQCKYFAIGQCSKKDKCTFIHDELPPLPPR